MNLMNPPYRETGCNIEPGPSAAWFASARETRSGNVQRHPNVTAALVLKIAGDALLESHMVLNLHSWVSVCRSQAARGW